MVNKFCIQFWTSDTGRVRINVFAKSIEEAIAIAKKKYNLSDSNIERRYCHQLVNNP